MHSSYCRLKPQFSEYQTRRQNEKEDQVLFLYVCEESQHALCGLLSHSAH